jgi:hypothetical protein
MFDVQNRGIGTHRSGQSIIPNLIESTRRFQNFQESEHIEDLNDQTVQTTFRTELYTSEEESNLYADLPVYIKNKEPGSGTFI